MVNLDEMATRRNARKAAMFEARGLVALHGISQTELKAVAAEIALERAAVDAKVAEVVALMERAGLTVADLVETPALSKSYRHPITGETWDGAGYQPDWLKRALLAEGYRPQELRVA